jgi:hypothetical protein
MLAVSMAEPARPITDHRLAFSMAQPARTDGQTGFLQERSEVGTSPSSCFLLCAWLPLVFCFALGYQEGPLVF